MNIKWETAKRLVPAPERVGKPSRFGILYCGTSATPMQEAMDLLAAEGIRLEGLRLRAFPFNDTVVEFVASHEIVFVVDQNRDGQLRTLLINELEPNPAKLASIRYYGGLSISAEHVVAQVSEHFTRNKLPRLNEVAR